MAILHNLVEPTKMQPMEELPSKYFDRLDEIALSRKRLQKCNEVRSYKRAFEIQNQIDSEVEELFTEVICNEKQLPQVIPSEVPEHLRSLNATPKASLRTLLNVAHQIGQIIIPWEYLSEQSYASEDSEMKQSIFNFSALESKGFDVYVMCPPQFYDYQAHIESIDPNKQIYAGQFETVFMTARLILSSLRQNHLQVRLIASNQEILIKNQKNIHKRLLDVEAQTQLLEEELEKTRVGVQQQLEALTESFSRTLENKLWKLKNDLEHQIRTNTRRERQYLHELNQALKSDMMSYIRCMMDPMLIAVPKGTKLTDRNAVAWVGPCWGPDFSDVLAYAAGLKVRANKELQKAVQVWNFTGAIKVQKYLQAHYKKSNEALIYEVLKYLQNHPKDILSLQEISFEVYMNYVAQYDTKCPLHEKPKKSETTLGPLQKIKIALLSEGIIPTIEELHLWAADFTYKMGSVPTLDAVFHNIQSRIDNKLEPRGITRSEPWEQQPHWPPLPKSLEKLLNSQIPSEADNIPTEQLKKITDKVAYKSLIHRIRRMEMINFSNHGGQFLAVEIRRLARKISQANLETPEKKENLMPRKNQTQKTKTFKSLTLSELRRQHLRGDLSSEMFQHLYNKILSED